LEEEDAKERVFLLSEQRLTTTFFRPCCFKPQNTGSEHPFMLAVPRVFLFELTLYYLYLRRLRFLLRFSLRIRFFFHFALISTYSFSYL
jgi:hypothetical protein